MENVVQDENKHQTNLIHTELLSKHGISSPSSLFFFSDQQTKFTVHHNREKKKTKYTHLYYYYKFYFFFSSKEKTFIFNKSFLSRNHQNQLESAEKKTPHFMFVVSLKKKKRKRISNENFSC